MNMKHKPPNRLILGICLALVAATAGAHAQVAPNTHGGNKNGKPNEFIDLDLESLMRIQVRSVAGRAEDWFTTPSALTVITSEDIRRRGHLSFPKHFDWFPVSLSAE
jgi:hypothetical protein